MLWAISWRPLLAILVALWWWVRRPRTTSTKLAFALAAFVAAWALGLPVHLVLLLAGRVLLAPRFHVLLLRHSNMILTLGAAAWLLQRTWQTLWRPVPELINILGVDVPDAPDVSLGGIKADAATLNWTRPPPNRPVQKYIIQVNGVNVGVSAHNETAITVTGLKPNRFYNVRVIAVGPNNFQAGSEVIRLRTWKRNGRPALGNSRLPDDLAASEPSLAPSHHHHHHHHHGDHPSDDPSGAGPRNVAPSVGAAPVVVDPAVLAPPPRDAPPPTAAGQRRNTLNRRHPLAVHGAAESAPPPPSSSYANMPNGGPEPSLQQLSEEYDRIRQETDEIIALQAKEDNEFKLVEEQLKREREAKKQQLKEKEERSDQLRKRAAAAQNQMRQAERDRAKKQKMLAEEEAKRSDRKEMVDNWNSEIEMMQKKRAGFETARALLDERSEAELAAIDEDTARLKEECSALERELKLKKDQLKRMEADRKKLPGGEDDARWRDGDADMRRNWNRRRSDLQNQLAAETSRSLQLDHHLRILRTQLSAQQPPDGAAGASSGNSNSMSAPAFYSHANSSNDVSFDHAAAAAAAAAASASATSIGSPAAVPTQLKRRSRNGTSLSSVGMVGPASPSPLPLRLLHGAAERRHRRRRPVRGDGGDGDGDGEQQQ